MKTLISIAVLVVLGSTALASETVEWPDLLDPSAQTFDDPFRDLSYAELESLRTIASARESLAEGGLTTGRQTELNEKILQADLQLQESGIDADWLIDQRWIVAKRREKAVTSGNPDVDGQVVILSGFAIPAPPDADGTAVAYLVPQRGMCSHMPPPNANQMVKVRLTDAWQPSVVHEPVRLTGKLSIVPTQEVIGIVDGPVQMNATFLMEVERAETLADVQAQAEKSLTNDWASTIAQKLRGSGTLPPAPQVSDFSKLGANAGAMEYCRANFITDDDNGRYALLVAATAKEFASLEGDKTKALVMQKAAEDGDYLGDQLDAGRCQSVRTVLLSQYGLD